MKIAIVEDEKLAQEKICSLLAAHAPYANVVAKLTSISEAIDFLGNNEVDVVFMDVELSDGICFEIFKHVDVKAKIVITTAYNQYAIDAFKIGSIDYLLKPISSEEFKSAFDRVKVSLDQVTNYKQLAKLFAGGATSKERFTIRIGDKIIIIESSNIAYFFAEDKVTYIVTREGKKYITDMTLDNIENVIDSKTFFRLSRGCIACIDSIKSIYKYLNGRLKVDLSPMGIISETVVVSRQRVSTLMSWLEGEV